jgi:3'(2'), 5'-bisphosphate nucleotidase
MNATDDQRVARELATGAGRLLLDIREQAGGTPSLGEAGDQAAHAYLMTALARLRPDDAVLSEEGEDDPERLTADRVWIIDPLDGTREFAERRDDWAVHVGLWERGTIAAAAVAVPARGLVVTDADRPVCPPAASGRPLRLVVSRSRPPAFAAEVAAAVDAELIPAGSAGAKTVSVVLGEADAYLHSGGQFEWDSAAPVGVATAAGLHASRIDGSALTYNQPEPSLPDLLVCRPDLAEPLLASVAGAT